MRIGGLLANTILSAITTDEEKQTVRLEILRAIGGVIRHAELSGYPDLTSVAILEPTDIDKPYYPEVGLYLTTVSSTWMSKIKLSLHAMDLAVRESSPLARKSMRTFRVIGWIDRRQFTEGAALAATDWSLSQAFRPDGLVSQIWIPSYIGGHEFYFETGDEQLLMGNWDIKAVMGI